MDYLLQIVVVAGLMMLGSQGCTDFKEYGSRGNISNNQMPDARKVHYSQVVVFGRILKKHVKGNFPYNNLEGVYTSSVEVYCVYKGENISKTINVVGMGNRFNKLEGCPKVPAKAGQLMILFLSPTNMANVYEVEYESNKGDIEDQLDELTIICGLEHHTLDHEGEEHVDNIELCSGYELVYEGCVEYQKPTPPTTPAPPTPKPKDSNNKDDDEVKVVPDQEEEQGNGKYDTNNPTNVATGEVTGDGNGGAVVVSSLLLVFSAALITLV